MRLPGRRADRPDGQGVRAPGVRSCGIRTRCSPARGCSSTRGTSPTTAIERRGRLRALPAREDRSAFRSYESLEPCAAPAIAWPTRGHAWRLAPAAMAAHPRVRGRYGPGAAALGVFVHARLRADSRSIDEGLLSQAQFVSTAADRGQPLSSNGEVVEADDALAQIVDASGEVVAFASPLASDSFLTPGALEAVHGGRSPKLGPPAWPCPLCRWRCLARTGPSWWWLARSTIATRHFATGGAAADRRCGRLGAVDRPGMGAGGRGSASGRADASGSRRDLGVRTGTTPLRAPPHDELRTWPRRSTRCSSVCRHRCRPTRLPGSGEP